MSTKLIKLAVLAAGAYVVASWAAERLKGPQEHMSALPAPSNPPNPPAYPTDPFYCYEHPDDPMCVEFVGI